MGRFSFIIVFGMMLWGCADRYKEPASAPALSDVAGTYKIAHYSHEELQKAPPDSFFILGRDGRFEMHLLPGWSSQPDYTNTRDLISAKGTWKISKWDGSHSFLDLDFTELEAIPATELGKVTTVARRSFSFGPKALHSYGDATIGIKNESPPYVLRISIDDPDGSSYFILEKQSPK